MKTKLFCAILACLCIACVVCCAACTPVRGQKDNPQARANAAVQAQADLMADLTFAAAEEGDPLVEARSGDADMYIVCHAEQGDSLVYVYQDVCYDPSRSYRYFDVYMPTAKEQLAPDTPVFLYLHGGGWVAGSRKDERLSLMPYIASTGMVVISMEYGLWFGLNQTESTPLGVYGWESMGVGAILSTVLANKHPVSVLDMMSDITACLTYMRDTYLPSLGLTATTIGMGGYSAGAHLSSLYTYKYIDQSPIRIGFLLDLVGPVKLLDENYIRLLDMLTGRAVDEEGNPDTSFDFLSGMLTQLGAPLAGILGVEEAIDLTTDEGYDTAVRLIAQYQPLDYLSATSVPTIICYAKSHDDIPGVEGLFPCDFDDFIPITIYQAISAKLDAVGIVHEDILFEEETHNTIGKSLAPTKWMATRVAAYSKLYCH